MKKYVLSIIMALFGFAPTCLAQDDDIYFVPSEPQEMPQEKESPYAKTKTTSNDDHFAHDNWADQRSSNDRDIDEYNRRSKSSSNNEGASTRDREDTDAIEVSCTERIVRFHSPTVGVYVSSPYYSEYVDIWIDPWYYDPWYGGYGYYGWNSWHHYYYWNNPWYYDPWYNPWCPYYGWYDPFYYRPGHYRPAAPAGAHYGPHGGYVYYGNRNSSGDRYFNNGRYGGRYEHSGRPSREYGGQYNNDRPSRRYGNDTNGRPSRNFGGSDSSRPSRRFGDSNTTRPSRDFTSPSRTPDRNIGTTPSRPRNTGNLGGNRNFGSGNNRGGRR